MGIPTKEKGRSFHTATLENKQFQSNKISQKSQSNFDRSALMSPPVVLDSLGIRYQRAGVWLAVYCPFHNGGKERKPSLSMNLKDGHYRCFTCGVKGGDVISFYRAVTGAGFVEGVRALGAWRAGV